MQGLVNFSTAIADGIAVLLPAFCYLAACGCFFFFAWTLWTWSQPHSRYHHIHHDKPWIPFVSLILCGVFATFRSFWHGECQRRHQSRGHADDVSGDDPAEREQCAGHYA